MTSTIERLLSLKVSDVMTCAAHTLSCNQTLEEAAATLSDFGLSAAPVVDEHGHCVGMLSASDFVRQLSEGSRSDAPLPAPDELFMYSDRAQPLDIDVASLHRVHRHMSTEMRTITAGVPLMEAARIMCAEHLHRLPVVDEQGHMLGLLNSLDVVAGVIGALEEGLQ